MCNTDKQVKLSITCINEHQDKKTVILAINSLAKTILDLEILYRTPVYNLEQVSMCVLKDRSMLGQAHIKGKL